ncbi:MAG: SAM-dependent methyltransferase, partial [Bacteroidales bacterium]|nr:SAM-dependent methyltransferase [Bacteroidales bacterium]
MENILHLTNDGSHTIYSKITEENYHSDNGAISESNHVFIKNGLAGINKTEISILEIGFGTGLNAFLSMLYAFENNLNITYTSIEKYPLKLDLVEKLNYAQMLNADKNLFLSLHNSDWGKTVSINKAFKICKINADLENYLYNADFNAD